MFTRKSSNALDGSKKTVSNKNTVQQKPKASQEKKAPVKKAFGESKSVKKHPIGRPIRQKFEDFAKVPKNATIVSDKETSKFYIEDESLRDHAIILEANYSPLGIGERMPCIILIFTSGEKSRLNIPEMTNLAKEAGKLFVADVKKNSKQFINELKKDIISRNKGDTEEEATGNRKRVIELFEDVLRSGASDLHIEVGEQTVIRARINGDIREFKEYRDGSILNRDTGYEFGRTIYNTFSLVSGMSFNPKITQDALGLIKNVNGQDLRIRIATAPTEPEGFDMVMRLLVVQDSSKPLTLEQLGYQEKQRNMIAEAVAQGVGVTIIAGTTGSGKSTTLQNVLMSEINNRNGKLKVITVEDPPEYFIPGASQIPVVRDKDGDAKKAFKNAIKASLRMDPDVIMIGEVRDEQSAELLIEAVQTGHKVMSTIHAGSALSILGRLENLGIDKDTLADNEFLSGLIYQKLFPVLCPHCSLSLKDGHIPTKNPIEKVLIENHFADEALIKKTKNNFSKVNIVRALQDTGELSLSDAERALEIFDEVNDEEENEKMLKRISAMAGNLSDHNIRFKGDGCEHCKNGIKGRTVVSEVVRPDMELRELISQGKGTAVFKYWRKNLGGKTAIEDSYDKMLDGKLSPIDIEDTFGFITPRIT